jgi:quercetin dioxygenase-like cupin family protein
MFHLSITGRYGKSVSPDELFCKLMRSEEKTMNDFPEFMRRPQNRIPAGQQNTPGVQGYYYTAADGSQMAFWTCLKDRVSAEHMHDFDEYVVCVAGEYVAILGGVETVLHPGDELCIPKGTPQGGRCKAGTRTLHAFGGRRIQAE